jgi:O-antigen ligase
MIDLLKNRSKEIAYYSLIGYFISTTFSHFLAQIAFALALLFSLVAFVANRRRIPGFKFNLFSSFIILFVGWSILSAVVGPTPLKSLLILKEEWLFLMIPVVAFVADGERKITIFLKTLAISAILVSIFGLIQHYIAPLIYHANFLSQTGSGRYRVSGGFSHYLTFGNYFAVAAVLFLALISSVESKSSRILFLVAFLTTTLAVILTYSYGPIMAVFSGIILFIIFFLRRNIRLFIPTLVIIIVAVALIAPKLHSRFMHTAEVEISGQYEGARLAIWRASAGMIKEHPIFGLGAGNFKSQYLNYAESSAAKIFDHAHNDVINVAAYAGIPAAIFYVGFWTSILAGMIKFIAQKPRNLLFCGVATGVLTGSVVFFITSLYECSFADEETRLFLMSLWGLFWACRSTVKPSGQSVENIEKT